MLLFPRRKPLSFVENQFLLFRGTLSFSGLGDRRDKLHAAAVFNYPLCWLALAIEFPMARRIFVGRIKDWMFKK